MRGVRISSLDLTIDGSVVVENLATIFADGEVIGASYLASSLRKEVETRGPLDMERVIRLYNSGYYGASSFSVEDRLWGKIKRSEGCWEWLGAKTTAGYGIIRKGNTNTTAHRELYQQMYGPVSDRNDVDHLCRNHGCMYPGHLEEVTHRENILRGDTFAADQITRTQCPSGHPYDKENTYWQGRKRSCLTCRQANNQSRLDKGRVYLKEGQEAPVGMRVTEGPRGGRYYETEAKRGRPLGEAPKGWKPREGERIRLRMPGSKLNGRLGRIRENHHDKDTDRNFSIVDGEGWGGGVYVNWGEGSMVPAPYTAKEKKEMTARDILIAEFGKTTRRGGEEEGIRMQVFDGVTELEYDVFTTEAGPELWVRAGPGKDKPWAVTKESAISLEAFMKTLPEMGFEALRDMKAEVKKIIFSPVSSPNDRKMSIMLGYKFTAHASMNMQSRIMHIYPAVKESAVKTFAGTLTHETGHAIDDVRDDLAAAYINKMQEFWDDMAEQGTGVPVDAEEYDNLKREHGIPPHPNQWLDAYGRWKDLDLGIKQPDAERYWPNLNAVKSWNSLTTIEQIDIKESVSGAYPVSEYARTDEHEYYAEAYLAYHEGRLSDDHIMFQHFDNMEKVKTWLQQ